MLLKKARTGFYFFQLPCNRILGLIQYYCLFAVEACFTNDMPYLPFQNVTWMPPRKVALGIG